jgi:hypothetical protein
MLTILALYFLSGGILLAVGPLGKGVSKVVGDARGSSVANAITGQSKVSNANLFLFRMILSAGVVLFWPVFLLSVLRKDIRRNEDRSEDTCRYEVGFQDMGGAGKICCSDCGYAKHIVSFVHGDDSSSAGYQCQSCGSFMVLDGSLPDRIEDACQCGGVVARDCALFCPQCRSKRLQYEVAYIA